MADHAPARAMPPDGSAAPLLQVQNLKKHFVIQKGLLRRSAGHRRADDKGGGDNRNVVKFHCRALSVRQPVSVNV